MPKKKKGNRKNPSSIVEKKPVVPSKKEVLKHRILEPTKTSYTPKNIHVTAIATAGKKKKI